MSTFTDDERSYLMGSNSITIDSDGNEVFAGLTLEETTFLLAHQRKFRQGDRDRRNRVRAMELRTKHEVARLQVLGALNEKANFSPTAH